MTQQPIWKLVAQLGDVNPIKYGGYFIYEDTTGVYAPEGELLFSPDDDDGQWEVRRFILEPCTYINGVLSDNKFHPDRPVWFADRIDCVASFIGISSVELIEMFVNGSIQERATAWQAIGQYHGYDNLDSYPLYFNRSEVEERYSVDLTKSTKRQKHILS